MKKVIKITIDILMFIIFVYLMSYRAGRGLLMHGVLGFTLFALFILHHILNIKWYGTITKGRYGFAKNLFIIINLILFFDMIVMAISSIMMSGDIFAFSPFIANQFARNIHVVSTAWGFVIMTLHLGLHTNSILQKMYNKIKIIYFIMLFIGIYCFIKSGIINSMFLIPKENNSFYDLIFYFEYAMITISSCQIIHLIFKINSNRR